MRKGIHFATIVLALMLSIGLASDALADVAGQLKDAEEAAKTGDLQQAEQIYKDVAAAQAGTDYGIQALEKLTCLYVVAGKEADVRAGLDELLSCYQGHKLLSTAVTHVGDAYRKAGRNERACEVYRDVIAAWPQDEHGMWSQMGLAMSYASLGDEAAAQSAFQTLRTGYTVQKHISRAVCIVGDHYRQMGKHKKAGELYDDVLTNWPDAEFALWARMGQAISRIKQYDFKAAEAAVESLRNDFAQDKRISTAACFVADEYRKAGRYADAAEVYEYVVQEHPEAEHAFWSQMGLAICHIRLKDEAKVTAAIGAVLAYSGGKDGRIPAAIRMVADEYRTLQRDDEAFGLYEYIVENYGQSKEALWSQMNMAISNIARSKGAEADAAVERLLAGFADDSDLPAAICWVGDEYRRLGQHAQACQLYERILDEHPASEYAFWAEMNLGISEIHLKDYAGAKAAVETVLAYSGGQDDRIAFAGRTLGDEYRKVQKYDEAFELYQYVGKNHRKTQEAMWSQMNLAIAKIGLGDPNADAETQRLLADYSKDPGIPAALCWVADQYRKSGSHDKARQLYQHVLDNYPDAEHALWSQMGLALSDIRTGEIETAEDGDAVIDRLILDFNDHPGLPQAVFGIGEEYYNEALFLRENEGLYEQAKKCYQKAVVVWERIIVGLPQSESTVTAHAYYFSAVCYRHLGEYQKPIDYCKKILHTWPNYQYIWHVKRMIDHCSRELEKSGHIAK